MSDSTNDPKKLRVMVVDDDENIAMALQLIVSSNFQCEKVEVAPDGMEAWEKIRTGEYDLVLSDWNMPRMDGNQLLKKMREEPATGRTAFLMLTVRKDVESVADAVKAGVTDYVIKPFDKDILLKRIEKLVGMTPVSQTRPLKAVERKTEEEPVDEKSISLRVMELIGKGEVTLPAMPQVIFTIEDALKKEDVDVHALSELIEMDAGISSRLIGVANSVFYRGIKECTLVEEAILRLGMQETKQLVYLISNRNLFALKDRRYEETIKDLYIHSIACGAAAQAMAKSLNLPDNNNYFALGLFHDIGKLLVLRVLSEATKDFRGLDLTTALKIMDSLHNKAGYMLLSKWSFPQVYSLVALHHEDISAFDKPEQELAVVHLANIFVRKLGFSLKADDGQNLPDNKCAKSLHLDNAVLQKTEEEVNGHVEKIKSILL